MYTINLNSLIKTKKKTYELMTKVVKKRKNNQTLYHRKLSIKLDELKYNRKNKIK